MPVGRIVVNKCPIALIRAKWLASAKDRPSRAGRAGAVGRPTPLVMRMGQPGQEVLQLAAPPVSNHDKKLWFGRFARSCPPWTGAARKRPTSVNRRNPG